jgi:hypothetical protein
VTSLYENYDTLEDNACDWPISTVSQPYVLRGLAQAASIPLDHPRQEERGSNAPDLAVPYVDNFDPFATHPRACQGYWARIQIFISDDPYNAPTGNGHTGLFRALGVPAQNPTYRRAAPLSFRWLFSSFLVSARRRAPRSSASPDGGSGTYLKHQVIWNTS